MIIFCIFPWIDSAGYFKLTKFCISSFIFPSSCRADLSSDEGSFLVDLCNIHPCADIIITISYSWSKETKK